MSKNLTGTSWSMSMYNVVINLKTIRKIYINHIRHLLRTETIIFYKT
ncbi:hypothetical protein [Candidatus Hodgkinia cicadicola]